MLAGDVVGAAIVRQKTTLGAAPLVPVIPSPLLLLVLALAAFRTYRLLALDDFPPLVWLRDRAVGARFGTTQSVEFQRPLLADWLVCAWCSGLWWSAAWYVFWLEQPRWAMYAAMPLALSAAVGVIQSVLPE